MWTTSIAAPEPWVIITVPDGDSARVEAFPKSEVRRISGPEQGPTTLYLRDGTTVVCSDKPSDMTKLVVG